MRLRGDHTAMALPTIMSRVTGPCVLLSHAISALSPSTK